MISHNIQSTNFDNCKCGAIKIGDGIIHASYCNIGKTERRAELKAHLKAVAKMKKERAELARG